MFFLSMLTKQNKVKIRNTCGLRLEWKIRSSSSFHMVYKSDQGNNLWIKNQMVSKNVYKNTSIPNCDHSVLCPVDNNVYLEYSTVCEHLPCLTLCFST